MDRPKIVRSPETLLKIADAVEEAHGPYADDLCWMEIDKIFAAAGLPVPDRKVGDKFAMLKNCCAFIDVMCRGGGWKSYAELAQDVRVMVAAFLMLPDVYRSQMADYIEMFSKGGVPEALKAKVDSWWPVKPTG